LALLTFALLAPAGCDQSAPTGQGTGGEVRLGYFANVTHAQAVIGVANGEYALAVGPNKLTTRVFNAGPSLVAALLAGEIDIGYVGPGPVLSAHDRSHGKGLRVVAGAAANGVLVVARKESSIQKMDDLKGKKIATPQLGNTQDVSAKHFLMSQLKQQDVDNVLAVNNSEQAALMARGDVRGARG
jgi:NitT/TauT family transport system substrate-binding protein